MNWLRQVNRLFTYDVINRYVHLKMFKYIPKANYQPNGVRYLQILSGKDFYNPYKKFLAKSEASKAKPRQPMRPWMPRNLFSWQKRHQRLIGFNFMASMAIKAIKTSKKTPNVANLAFMAILLGRIYGIQGNNYK